MTKKAKPTVYVIEDEADLRESVCEELDRVGYSTVALAHGEKALALLRRGSPPALILLDLLMPQKDGWEVVAAVKADPRMRDVPIIVMSAVAPQARSLQAQGVAATLPKPFTVTEMLFVVNKLVPITK